MADIIDIDVFQTVTSVSFEVEPNTNIININKVTSGGSGGGGATDLSTTQTATNFTINSDTGTDAVVPLGNGTLAGATLNDYTTAEKNKLTAITGTNTGDNATNTTSNAYADAKVSDTAYDATSWNGVTTIAPSKNAIRDKIQATGLQEITNINASTTNPINVNVTGVSTGLQSGSTSGKGIFGYSNTSIGVEGYSQTGIGVRGYSEDEVGGSFETEGTTANIANFKKSGSIVASVTNNGNINANGFVKSGGTSSQILAADGSVITAGTNITITGGQISSVGGAGGGGSSVNYYLNGGTSQGTFGGTTYYEFSKTAVIGTGADFTISSNGYIASFITDVADPSLLLIPAGNWNLEFFFSSSSAGGSPEFYAELYKYDGTTFTLIASGSAVPEGITNGTSIDAYFTALAVPETVLTVNDRLAIRVYVNASSKTITLHTQNGHLCEVITTFTAGLTALNGLQAQVQNFATGTTGTDFAINSSGSTHTFNLPDASATARGAITTGSQTIAGAKTFSSNIVIPATGSELILRVSSGGTVSGLSTTTYPDLTELSYVKGVTSAIQTQFSGKQPLNANLTSISGLAYSGSVPFVRMYAPNLFSLDTNTYLTSVGIANLTATGTPSATTYLRGDNTWATVVSGATNLTYTPSPTNGIVVSSTGDDATLPLADATNAGLLKPAKFTVLENTSGTNTGDQDLSGLVVKNTAITGATNTKITYDAKGLVTAGTSLIATDIPTITQAQVTNLTTDLAAKAPLASPTFTGTPSLPTGTTGVTQTAGDNTTKLATTAFVTSALSSGGVTVSPQEDFYTTASIATVTAAEYAGFVTAGTVSTTTLYFITV